MGLSGRIHLSDPIPRPSTLLVGGLRYSDYIKEGWESFHIDTALDNVEVLREEFRFGDTLDFEFGFQLKLGSSRSSMLLTREIVYSNIFSTRLKDGWRHFDDLNEAYATAMLHGYENSQHYRYLRGLGDR